MPDPNRPVGARLHKLARALVDVGHEGEAVRVLTLAMRHLPTSDLNFVTRRRLVAQATGTPDTPVVRELRREGLAALERGEAEGVTLLAGALRVGGPAAWPGVEVRLSLRRLQPVTRLRLGQMVLQPVARAAYELGWLGQQDLAARVGMLIPTVPQMAFDIAVSQAETSPELEHEIKGLSDELRQKGYLPEAAELAATVIDLGRWRQAFPRMFLNSFEVTVLPIYNIRLTGWDRVKLGAGALRDRVVPTRTIFKSELSEIDVSAGVLPLPAAPPPPDVPPPGALPPPGEPPPPFAPKAIRSATAFPETDPSTTHPVSGEPLTITVRLTDAPSPFVWSEAVVLGKTPPEAVHTFSVHLVFGGTSAWGTLEYSVAGGTSKPAVFPVMAPPLAPGAVRRVETIAVNFYLGHRWSGEGYGNVEIRADASVLPSRAIPVPGDPAWRRTLAVAPNAAPPDLLVRIQRDPARPDTYVWTCLSRWADLRPPAEGDDRLPMPDGAERFVKNLFEPLATTELGPLMQRRVEGAGQDIALDLSESIISTAIPGINRTAIYTYAVPLPPLIAQVQIVKFLDAIGDRARQADLPELPSPLAELRPVVARIEELADEIGRARALQHQSRKQVDLLLKSARGAAFAELADEPVRLAAVCSDVIDNLHSNPRYADVGVPCVRSPDIGWGSLNLDTALRTDKAEYLRRTVRGEPQPDDIVLVREGGGTGKCALVSLGQRFSLGQRVMMLRPDPARVLPRFLLHQLLSPVVQEDQIVPLCKGSASPHLNIAAVKRLTLRIPSLADQSRIVANLYALSAKVEAVRTLQTESGRALGALLPSIVARAFKGEPCCEAAPVW